MTADPSRRPGGAPGGVRHPDADRVLLLGVVGAVVPVVAPFAWRAGNRVLAEIDAGDRLVTNRPSAVAGRICGMVVTVVWGIVLVVVSALVVIGGISAIAS